MTQELKKFIPESIRDLLPDKVAAVGKLHNKLQSKFSLLS